MFNVSKVAQVAAFDRENPFLKNSYATLKSVLDTIRGPMIDNGLHLEQYPTEDGLVSRLVHHPSGEAVEFVCPIKCEDKGKNPCQAFGAGISYARRYSIVCLFNLTSGDDDGNGAYDGNPKEYAKPKPDPTAAELKAAKKAFVSKVETFRTGVDSDVTNTGWAQDVVKHCLGKPKMDTVAEVDIVSAAIRANKYDRTTGEPIAQGE